MNFQITAFSIHTSQGRLSRDVCKVLKWDFAFRKVDLLTVFENKLTRVFDCLRRKKINVTWWKLKSSLTFWSVFSHGEEDFEVSFTIYLLTIELSSEKAKLFTFCNHYKNQWRRKKIQASRCFLKRQHKKARMKCEGKFRSNWTRFQRINKQLWD